LCWKKYIALLWFAATPGPPDRTEEARDDASTIGECRFRVEDRGLVISLEWPEAAHLSHLQGGEAISELCPAQATLIV
jgi:hypothetical protein